MNEPTQWQRDLMDWMLANPGQRTVINTPRQHGRGYVDRQMKRAYELLGIKVIEPDRDTAHDKLKGAQRDDPLLRWFMERDA